MIAVKSEALAEGDRAATKTLVFNTAERLFALRGLQAVSVRDITTEAGVNLAALNYYFRSKDALLLEIFVKRASQLNRERARLLHEARARHHGDAPVREILDALIRPPVRWLAPEGERFISIQFLIRARAEGTEDIRAVLRDDVSHLRLFADALRSALPRLPAEEIYWRLHFVLGMIQNNQFSEFDRLDTLSNGLIRTDDLEHLVGRMVDFAEAGFSR